VTAQIAAALQRKDGAASVSTCTAVRVKQVNLATRFGVVLVQKYNY
jgi:hypothetical protein